MPVRDLLFAASTQGAAPSDPDFEYVTLLLNGDGTNGAQNNTFLDSSTNNFTITRNGNTTQGSFSPYGSNWSTFGSYFTVPDNSAFDFGSGDFTIEGWINPPDSAQTNIICRNFSASTGFILSTTNFLAAISTAWDISITFSSGFTGGQWSHFAVVRNGNVFTCYINGTSVGTQTISGTIASSSGDVQIGRRNGQTNFVGYLSNLRIVKGTAVYTTTFTPPTVPLTAISGTSLLASQSNRFSDASTNNFTVTPVGSPSVQRFSPFNPTAPYSTSVIGGSGYFDGSGDYLAVANNAVTDLDSANWTWEAWVYPIATGNEMGIGCSNLGTNSTGLFRFGILSDANLWCDLYDGGSFNVAPPTSPYRAWHHFAVTKSGSTITMYYDGVSVGSFSKTTTILGNSINIGLGAPSSVYWGGYIAGHRLVVGSVLYTTTFTPPSTPPTAITNTRVLANMTNAGIPDLAMMNNLETVGNAQVSTSVKKYGTGSLYFDGSGDRLFVANSSPVLSLANSDYTVEMWIYPNSFSGDPYPISSGSTGGTFWAMYITSSGALGWGGNNGPVQFSAGTISTGAWTHIAISQSGSNVYWFIGGVLQLTKTKADVNNANWVSANQLSIGSNFGSNQLDGYIDDLRITKGYARYTANFTPPTAALPTF